MHFLTREPARCKNQQRAPEQVNARWRERFSPDLLPLFTQWAFAQHG
jgi:hypothetical protein